MEDAVKKGECSLKDFLEYLAYGKYRLYYRLYKHKSHAYTESDCIERLNELARYKELINVIENLPLEHKRAVDELFEERKSVDL